MEALFLKLVNMSITAGWLVLAIAAIRLLFPRTPKSVCCILWGMVALRLIFPFSLESSLSLIPSPEPLPKDIIYTAKPELQSGIVIVDNTVNPMLASSLTPIEPASANPTQIWSFLFSRIWVLGIAVMLLYMLVSYILLHRKVAASIPVRQNIRCCEFIGSPFVLGLIAPRIYLPASLEKRDWGYVLKHEETHIEYHDHWWKLLGFLLLAVYWFNPLIWLAYILFCRDLEGACDERVIRTMDKEERRAYAAALLKCSIRHRSVSACPLAFGEESVKKRIKGVMNYKKPGFWVKLMSALLCALLVVGFLTNPEKTYDYDRVYPQAQLKAPDHIEVFSGNGESIVHEKGTEKYNRILKVLKRNWWKYTAEDLETASDDMLIPVPAPEVIRTKSWKRYVEMSDDIIELIYASDPVIWENADGESMEIRMIAFLLPEKGESEGNTKRYFILSRETDFSDPAGIYSYYYPPELAHDFWRFHAEKLQEEATKVEGKTMSINDVIMLSQKGDDLVLADFEGFAYEETGGSLLYNRVYPINESYALWVGHGGGLEKPIYIWLTHLTSGEHFSITQGNADNQITDFVASHG